MNVALDTVLKLLGLSTPFLYAATTYTLFHFLDRKASGAAKAAINNWSETAADRKANVGNALLELFDKIYKAPLWSLRSFARSATLSALVMAIFSIDVFLRSRPRWDELPMYLIIASSIIVSDYVSLFLVRKFLTLSEKRPALAMIGGCLVGVIIVELFFAVRTFAFVSVFALDPVLDLGMLGKQQVSVGSPEFIRTVFEFALQTLWYPYEFFVTPALVVHLWLPLVGIGIAFTRAVKSFAWSVANMQWFLKQGRYHPLQAIGYVAATVVFVVATSISILGRFWS